MTREEIFQTIAGAKLPLGQFCLGPDYASAFQGVGAVRQEFKEVIEQARLLCPDSPSLPKAIAVLEIIDTRLAQLLAEWESYERPAGAGTKPAAGGDAA